jgi:hypothetical protein
MDIPAKLADFVLVPIMNDVITQDVNTCFFHVWYSLAGTRALELARNLSRYNLPPAGLHGKFKIEIHGIDKTGLRKHILLPAEPALRLLQTCLALSFRPKMCCNALQQYYAASQRHIA